MKRLLAIGLVVTVGNASAAFAEESLLASATRLIASTQTSAPAKVVDAAASNAVAIPSFAKAAGVREAATLAQQGGSGTISKSALSKRTKALILSGVAASFVGITYGIDHRVRDVTPSSLGTREDNSVFGK